MTSLASTYRQPGEVGDEPARRAEPGQGGPMGRIGVVYHFFPHYRLPVMRALDRSEAYSFDFIGQNASDDGIVPIDPGKVSRFVDGPYTRWGRVYLQPAAIKAALSGNYEALIMLANPNFLTTWLAAALARLTGKKVLFWTHGWLRPEGRIKTLLRNTFLGLAHKVLVYGERARRLGALSGFPASRIAAIYNSLDADAAAAIFARLEQGSDDGHQPKDLFTHPQRPLVICTARLIAACRFDLLLEAAAQLRQGGTPVNILLIGDGPERQALEETAGELGLDVHFYGACYDEQVLGALIYHADITVSPGKIGLTAMHSLTYGTPVITHGDLDRQMPEVEAIEAGVTGALFRRDDVDDLAATIAAWLDTARDRAKVRRACRTTIETVWNPSNQARLIEAALDEVLAGSGRRP